MRVRVLSLFAALLLVAACGTTEQETATVGGAGTTQVPTAPISGVMPGSVAEFQQTVGDTVYFGFDQSDLSPEARATLDRQAQWLQQYPSVRVTIEGHADERGTREYNLALGERRAASVRSYLVALGVDPSRLTTISYGKERPAVMGSNEAAWAQNRRAVTVLQ